MGRWRAVGKYRWRRQPEGQYSLLYNLSLAALNYLTVAAAAAAGAAGGRFGGKKKPKAIEELGEIKGSARKN